MNSSPPAIPSVETAYRTLRRRSVRDYAEAFLVTAVVTAFPPVSDPSGLVLLAPSLLLGAAVLFTGWDRMPPRLLMAASLAVGAATLALTALWGDLIAGGVGLSVTLATWAAHRSRRRMTMSAVIGGGVLAVLSLRLVTVPDTAVSVALAAALLAWFWAMTVITTDDQRHLLRLLERAKDAEREASLQRQRSAFAADLHDVQGHTLHVIKLKAAVAAKVQHSDPERTASELRTIQELVATSIEQGRQLAHASHRLVLAAELANAVELFDAAGIQAEVDPPRTPETPYEPEMALALRESTTNILRHARASAVRISISERELVVGNDGAPAPSGRRGGLATLEERVGEAGGTLRTERRDGTFLLRLSFEEAR
ncbi:sensor histidine kinase [Rothia halotolerans]|uniref:sensor histidine kinase n=1 Tax=Rothia halotolerans TaxID=405770 RepID=UPI00101B6B54|nr:histidine kinase [Rothia halotolerans]